MEHACAGDLEPQVTAGSPLSTAQGWILDTPLPCPLVPWLALSPLSPAAQWPLPPPTLGIVAYAPSSLPTATVVILLQHRHTESWIWVPRLSAIWGRGMATWHLIWPEMRPSTFGGGIMGANLLPPFIPGTEHILTRKLKSPGSHHWLLIASVDQWKGKMAPGHQHRADGRGDLAAESCICECLFSAPGHLWVPALTQWLCPTHEGAQL